MRNNVQRLHDTIESVCPIDGVSVGNWGQAGTVRIDFDPTATDQQKSAAQQALASFDWSDAAEAAWEAAQNTSQTIGNLSATDPVPRAARAGCIALMASLDECRVKLNEIITTVNSKLGTSITTLAVGDTVEQALATVQAMIEAGQV